MADANRKLTLGEVALLRSVYAGKIDYAKARIHSERWSWPFPQNRAMPSNGDAYFPGTEYAADFSSPSTPLSTRATFVHEGAHLYQWYGLHRTVWARGPFARNYDYDLVPGRKYEDYGLEQMGMIAQHYYILREGGRVRGHTLADYAQLLPVRS